MSFSEPHFAVAFHLSYILLFTFGVCMGSGNRIKSRDLALHRGSLADFDVDGKLTV